MATSLSAADFPEGTLIIEAEGFRDRGGWVIDQQSMDVMGSPYLLAHGLGVPVGDALTTIDVPSAGSHRVWARTRDWVAPWKAEGAPGRFQLLVNGQPLQTTFGTEGAHWHWQDGGSVHLPAGKVAIALHDLTGFDGRCDAIVFSPDPGFRPPEANPSLAEFRQTLLGLPAEPDDGGEYDLVVVGGGMAGCCAAVSAARLGCTVALIQDRPILGGNNSSEVRVGLSGLVHQAPYPRLGDLVDEIGPVGHWPLYEAKRDPESDRSKRILDVIEKHPEKKIHNAGPASNYEDDQKRRVAVAEKNLRLFLNTHVLRVEKESGRIAAVIGKDIVTNRERRFRGRLFVDCTGDGTVGFLASADFRVGREASEETGESRAPEKADPLVMGTSVQWYAIEESRPIPFPDCPWAVRFTNETCQRLAKGDIDSETGANRIRGDWDWETGMNLDQVTEIERIRDHALRATFGNWAFLKNHSDMKERVTNYRLAWVAHIGGKRESRRLLGDVILQEQDIVGQRAFPDACVTTTWSIDLHHPHPENSRLFPGEEFRSIAKHTRITPYPIPYRCLYSRNVGNLMMAGRDISVTHVALGTVRVQRTTGMMGEVVGMAASICKKHGVMPRGVYESHLEELKALMRRGVGKAALAVAGAAGAAPVRPGFSVSGEWSYGGLPSHQPGKATIYSHALGATATWNPQIRTAGPMRVSFFNAAHPGNDPTAIVEIIHAGQTDKRTVDQTRAPSGWVNLGEFEFAGRGDECVRLRAGTKGKNLRAAAVKFEWLGPAGGNLWANLMMDDVTIYDPSKFAPKPVPFTDIAGHWAEPEIRDAFRLGILNGVSAERFGPDEAIALADLRDALAKLELASPSVTAALASEKGRPSGARLARLFAEMARATGKNLQWAKPAGDGPLAMPTALRLVGPGEGPKFQTGAATRGQAAALLVRFQRHILDAGPPIGAQWELTFDDEFIGSGLDWDVWKSAQGESWGKLLSARFPENVAVSGGLLRLITRKERRGGKDWTSAFISTKTFRQQYGYWEASIRYAGAPGLNNAFWTNPDKTFEIDINEGHFPHIVNSTLHQNGLPSSTTRYLAPVDLSLDFHTYAAAWGEKEIIFYFDGREIGRKPNVKAHAPGPVMFSTAVFGSWAGPLTDDLDGKSMDVDWVRVYRRGDAKAAPVMGAVNAQGE
ncbi:MAG TPA: FAD-dependent oxidoreductase [Verrucomicrobiae bacterium]|nr:FAD-dependent oxidoreductase [Verrucomicrobiae bacterium]